MYQQEMHKRVGGSEEKREPRCSLLADVTVCRTCMKNFQLKLNTTYLCESSVNRHMALIRVN